MSEIEWKHHLPEWLPVDPDPYAYVDGVYVSVRPPKRSPGRWRLFMSFEVEMHGNSCMSLQFGSQPDDRVILAVVEEFRRGVLHLAERYTEGA